MSRLFILIAAALLPAAAAAEPPAQGASAYSPVIFFSDLTSGPNYGGESGDGVFVTLRGNNFGSARDESYVTVGGGRAGRYLHWSDSKIIFQLGREARSGLIQVHSAPGSSNGTGFRVRGGRIFFVDASARSEPGDGTVFRPWKSPASFYRVMRPGDTCYIREGVYRGKYGIRSSHANVGFGHDAPDGSSGNEIAWVGYPNERPVFEALGDNPDGCFEWKMPKDHYVIAGLRLRAGGRGCVAASGRYVRIINNECEGTDGFSYAMVFLNHCVFAEVLGNSLRGMSSGNKLSHPFYIGGGGREIDFGWNSVSGNDVAEGPLILVNQDEAQQREVRFAGIRIHDNLIDGAGEGRLRPRGIGFASQAKGSSALVYNNIIINCSKALYAISGSVRFINNTVCGAAGPSAIHIYGRFGYRPEEVQVINNALEVNFGCEYIALGEKGNAEIDSNAYNGNGSGYESDAHAVNGAPGFIDKDKGNFRLRQDSPLREAGTSRVTADVVSDYDGVRRPWGKSFDIGAFEYRE